MKRFQMITEADARSLDYGSSVVLLAGVHVTPLASDTLKERRVTVVREGSDPDLATLAPVSDIRTVALGSDHTGIALKAAILAHLRTRGLAVHDVGTNSSEPVDYPDFAEALGTALRNNQADRGVLVCGSGVGASVAANKIPGVRAGLCHDTYSAHQGVEHDDMNVLVLGARVIGLELAKELVERFVTAQFTGEERHRRRLEKIKSLETRYRNAK